MLRPFFSYFGSKVRLSKFYPEPIYDSIIEPFAGSATYSLRHYKKKIFLYEKDPIVAEVWKYLISEKTNESEILSLPTDVYKIDDHNLLQEQKWLIGFWLNQAANSPRKTMSKWGLSGLRPNMYWGDSVKHRIANQVKYIKHWKIKNESYHEAENIEATWFIDPPYQVMGKYYRFGNNQIDYNFLGEWCKDRKGQIMVCENDGADWLEFQQFRNTLNAQKKTSKEVIWYKETKEI